jgi:hypothetical protein
MQNKSCYRLPPFGIRINNFFREAGGNVKHGLFSFFVRSVLSMQAFTLQKGNFVIVVNYFIWK